VYYYILRTSDTIPDFQIVHHCIFQASDTILIHAVKGGHLELVRMLINKYADVDVEGAVSHRGTLRKNWPIHCHA
jgi:hypothetical protein